MTQKSTQKVEIDFPDDAILIEYACGTHAEIESQRGRIADVCKPVKQYWDVAPKKRGIEQSRKDRNAMIKGLRKPEHVVVIASFRCLGNSDRDIIETLVELLQHGVSLHVVDRQYTLSQELNAAETAVRILFGIQSSRASRAGSTGRSKSGRPGKYSDEIKEQLRKWWTSESKEFAGLTNEARLDLINEKLAGMGLKKASMSYMAKLKSTL